MARVSDAPELIRRARDVRVVVIGGGIAGLVAAHECAKVGLSVTLLEAGDALGGTIGRADLAGVAVDTGADRWAATAADLHGLVTELGLGDSVITPDATARWLAVDGRAAPLPVDSVLGIPANAWGEPARRFLGWRGAWRAYLDRLRPPLTIGHEHSLGDLVRRRMGTRVVDRMVAPLSRGVFGVEPDAVDVSVAAPGLNAALTRTGSLAGAVASLAPEASDPAVLSLRGGLYTLVAALETALLALAVDIRIGTCATGLEKTPAGWRIDVAAAQADPAPAGLDADVVVVATEAPAARSLLAAAVVLPAAAAVDDAPEGDTVDVVTVLVASAALDGAPRGAEVHAADGSASVVHADAVWPWLRDRLDPGIHLLRVTLPADGAPRERTGDAVAAVSPLFGVDSAELRPIAAVTRRRWRGVPAAVRGHLARAAAVRQAAHDLPGLAVVGAGISGSGLARVIADSLAEADRVRSDALWHDDGPGA